MALKNIDAYFYMYLKKALGKLVMYINYCAAAVAEVSGLRSK